MSDPQNPFAEDNSPPDISQVPSLDDIEGIKELLKIGDGNNDQAIEIVVQLHATDPDGFGTVASLTSYAMDCDPQLIAFMWAAAIYRLGDLKAHPRG